jgi:cobalt-zinc-cadmium efflux system outer membrane protein
MNRVLPWSVTMAAALLLSGCGVSSSTTEYPTPRPLGRDLVIPPELGGTIGGAVGPKLASVDGQPVTSVEPMGSLTLQRALAQALTGSPELAQFPFDVRAAEARTLQAGYRLNPEVSLLTEDFGGNRGRGSFRASQTTLMLSQVIELGGKRANRLRLARLDASLAAWDYEAKRLDVFTEAVRTFVDVLAAQRKVALAEDVLRLERQFYSAVSERARVGDVSPLEERRAQVTLSNSQIALEQARRELGAARARLAATWGSRQPQFERADGDLTSGIVPPPPLQAMITVAAQNPDVARWAVEIGQREARVSVERAKNIPDITVQGGSRRYGDGGSAFVAGVAIGLPVFGLNRGNLLDAQSQLGKSRIQQQAAEVRIASSLQQVSERLSAAYETVIALQRNVLPAAQTAYDGVSTGYRQGKFSLIEALDAQRALFDARNRLIDALATYQTTFAEAERLTGQPLRDAPASTTGTQPGGRP